MFFHHLRPEKVPNDLPSWHAQPSFVECVKEFVKGKMAVE